MVYTSFLAELIGLMLLAVGASLLFQGKIFMKALTDITENRSVLFMVGVALLLCGLLIVLTHNIWNMGYLSLAITLIGWVLIFRGLISMFLPAHDITLLVRWFKVNEFAWLYGILVIVIGAGLTYSGF